MLSTTSKILAIGLESVACCAVIAGICIEAITGAEVGYIIISAGSLGVAAGSILYAKILITRGKS